MKTYRLFFYIVIHGLCVASQQPIINVSVHTHMPSPVTKIEAPQPDVKTQVQQCAKEQEQRLQDAFDDAYDLCVRHDHSNLRWWQCPPSRDQL